MLFRLIGKLYFYFCVLPFIGRVLSNVIDTQIKYFARKSADPTWTMQKQRAEDLERLNRRRHHCRTH